MSAPKNHRWVCPHCGRGVNAPSRLRKDDTRRYCLPCSERTGRLAERECLAHLRKQAKARKRRSDKAKRERAKTADARKQRTEQLRALRREARDHQQQADERRARYEALTIVATSEPDVSLWVRTTRTRFEAALDLGVECATYNRAGGLSNMFVPRWYFAIVTRLEKRHALPIEHLPRRLAVTGLIRFVARDAQLQDALRAVANLNPDGVLPFIADNYPFPIPDGIVELIEQLQSTED